MAKDGDLEKIKKYLQNALDKIPTLDYHFCENQSVDNVIGYYYALAAMLNLGKGSGPMDHGFAIKNEYIKEAKD